MMSSSIIFTGSSSTTVPPHHPSSSFQKYSTLTPLFISSAHGGSFGVPTVSCFRDSSASRRLSASVTMLVLPSSSSPVKAAPRERDFVIFLAESMARMEVSSRSTIRNRSVPFVVTSMSALMSEGRFASSPAIIATANILSVSSGATSNNDDANVWNTAILSSASKRLCIASSMGAEDGAFSRMDFSNGDRGAAAASASAVRILSRLWKICLTSSFDGSES
mmetsp:Transcript_34485/g.83441  ORF Transcript_34485/g.83441 Transcript_34485/m.83441 type:complete len:221 (-) Transcript_34485:894-1556(-)